MAGLNLVEDSSGGKKGAWVISKRGRRGVRNLLYQASLILVAKNKEFKTLYHYLLDPAREPLCKKQALVAISMKLLRVPLIGITKECRGYSKCMTPRGKEKLSNSEIIAHY